MTNKDLELMVFYALLLITVIIGVLTWRSKISHNTVTGTCDTLSPTAMGHVFIDSDISKDDSTAIYTGGVCDLKKWEDVA